MKSFRQVTEGEVPRFTKSSPRNRLSNGRKTQRSHPATKATLGWHCYPTSSQDNSPAVVRLRAVTFSSTMGRLQDSLFLLRENVLEQNQHLISSLCLIVAQLDSDNSRFCRSKIPQDSPTSNSRSSVTAHKLSISPPHLSF